MHKYNNFNKQQIMKKLIFFIVIVFVSQMFCENVMSQDWTQNYNNYIFKMNSEEFMRISRGASYDLQMYFPHTVPAGGPRWNRIIAQGQLAFFTNNRGLSDSNVDMLINASGNVGIGGLGSDAITEKLTVAGNLRLENNGKLISNNELEFSGNIFSFNTEGVKGLQLKKGLNNDFTLFFPVSDATNRIIAANNLSFTAGNRGTTQNETDLFIHTSGNVGIGTTNPSEKLTVSGNILSNSALYANKIESIFTYNNGVFSSEGVHTNKIVFWGIENSFGTRSQYATLEAKPYGGNLELESFYPISFNMVGTDSVDLFINSSGNVGIGTNFPTEKLIVNGSLKIDKNANGNNSKLFINVDPDSIKNVIKDKFSAFIAGGILSEDYAISPKSGWADHVFNADYRLQNLNEVESFININKHLPGIPSATEVQENGYTIHDMNVKLLQKVEELTLYSIEQNKEIEQLKKVVNSYETLLEKVSQLESKINQ
jgi:hypothetical protein